MSYHDHIHNEFVLFSCDTEKQSLPHYHSYAEVLFADSHTLNVLINDKESIELQPRELIFIPPHQRHYVQRQTNTECCRSLQLNLQKLYFLFAQSPYVKPINQLYFHSHDTLIYRKERAENITAIFDQFKNEFMLQHVGGMIEIIRLLSEQCDDTKMDQYRHTCLRENNLCASLNFMLESDPSMSTKIEDLAQHFYMSKSTFHRLFKKTTGMTFHQWLMQRKMNIACMSLREEKHSIQDISEMLGFSSASHFSKSFKEHYGITPRDFRYNNLSQSCVMH